ncbi:NlpC/P60 family protein [Caloramator fervidus]|uniref:NlpC/P60 family protein n=1 Tax=Caloramator fervidus TaxID=29344 RepID=A0A1H5VS02_9CLOT|nr:C40 family peptidase [Caloramator fervidus]SEF90010.1 NlpC/P60 family protein [Caloramator fervidus]
MKRFKIILFAMFFLVVLQVHTKANSLDQRNKVALSRGPQLVSYATRFLGTRYRYSGQTPFGFDCSGFTSYVYRCFGYNIPHSSKEQYKIGVRVSKSQLLPGDLVFFNTNRKGISHVGIYIGNGKFIHASSGKGYVTITSLNDSYYLKRYVGAVRVFR